MNENIKKKNVGLILIILSITVVIAIGTYAALLWTSQENTKLTLRIGQLADVVFVTGDDVNIENMGPVFNYEQDGEVKEFYISNLTDNKLISNVKLNITTISEELKEESFKYVFLSSSDGITYEKVNEGNFSGVVDGTTINLISGHVFLENAYYKLIFYIDGNVNNPIDMQNGSLTGYISADVNVVYGLESQSEITSDEADFLSTSIPRNKIYSINFVSDDEVSELLAGNNVEVLDETINENSDYPYFDVSQAKDRSIKLYYKEYIDEKNVSLYDVIISTESGKTVASSGAYLFSFLTNMKTIDLTNLDTSEVTTMESMFRNSFALTTLDVSSLNTQHVTNMYGMFSSSNLSKPMALTSIIGLDSDGFDTSNVTDMSAMFQLCSNLTTLNVSNFSTGSVTNMSGMFNYCSGLTTLDVSNFSTGSVTTMRGMFNGCSNLTTLNIGDIDTNNVENMEIMFRECSRLTTLDVSGLDTGKVTNMKGMFYGCTGLPSINVSNFDTKNVTDMSQMFASIHDIGDMQLENIEGLENFDTRNVTNMGTMFQLCRKLTTIDLSSFDTRNVTNMGTMFSGCVALETVYASDSFVTTKVTASSSMFNNCTNIRGGNGTTYNASYEDATYARIDTSSNPGYFTEFVEQ